MKNFLLMLVLWMAFSFAASAQTFKDPNEGLTMIAVSSKSWMGTQPLAQPDSTEHSHSSFSNYRSRHPSSFYQRNTLNPHYSSSGYGIYYWK